MNGKEELRDLIKSKHERIHSLINKFILTPEIHDLMAEIATLQVQCGQQDGHEYHNGTCIWCGHKEDKDK